MLTPVRVYALSIANGRPLVTHTLTHDRADLPTRQTEARVAKDLWWRSLLFDVTLFGRLSQK